MSLTLIEVQERLKSLDEITLLERLQISSEDLCERFLDKIEDKYEEFSEDFEKDLQTEGE